MNNITLDSPKVTVRMLAYKHKDYIGKALDSVLMQKTNFKYEIIISDDCSNDGTEQILKHYKELYPDIITYNINDRNLGVTENSLVLDNMMHGEYITSLECDDYWLDENKLQKQVDFLDRNPAFQAVATNYVLVTPEGDEPQIMMYPWQVNKAYKLKHFLKYGLVIHGNSLMIRNNIDRTAADFLALKRSAPTMGDVITRVLLYDRGDIFVLPDITLAHRDGRADKTSFTAQDKNNAIKFCEMKINQAEALTKYFGGKYCFDDLIITRNALVIMNHFFDSKYDRQAWKSYMKKMSTKVRIASYIRTLQKLFRRIIRKFYRIIFKPKYVFK